MVKKVAAPSKKVTDAILLGALAEQGIDRDYVEFYQDYTQGNPYTKLYRDLKSNKKFMVVSGLPMVDAGGNKVEVGWEYADGRFTGENNLFKITVQGTQVDIRLKNDQPDGKKKTDELSYHAQLFIDGEELSAPEPALLEVDPVNANYLNNVLEWDYGICKRRLRLIEGRVLGSWVFRSKPPGTVRIKYNQAGDFKLRLGRFRFNDDEEVITPNQFDDPSLVKDGYPVEVSDSLTVYPDADPESATVDGYVGDAGNELSWSDLIGEPGSVANDSVNGDTVAQINSSATTNKWANLYRAIFLFDTSSLPDDATIQAATLSLYGGSYAKIDSLGITPNVNVYSSSPASNTALAAGDFDSFGSTPFCDTPIAYGDWNDSGYNDFSFNASGLAAISKTGVSKFGTRNANYDVAENAPNWSASGSSYLCAWYAEKGSGYKPKLVITYEEGGATEKESSDSGTGTDAKDSFPEAVLEGAEAGSGAETAGVNAGLVSGDTGTGADNSQLSAEEAVFGSDVGSGSDAMKVLIAKAVSGSEMNLPGSRGRVRMPQRGINL